MRMRSVLLVAGACILNAAATCMAQAWPSRPIRMIVPFPAGGPTDSIGRPISQSLADALGQPVILDNRPGANSILGADLTAHSPPNGYTMLLGTISTLALNPAGYKSLPYDPMRDFAHIAKLVSSYHLIVARKGLPASNIGELVALARKSPGSVSFGTTGIGSSGHFAYLMLESAAGVKMLHVPYKGASQVVTDLLSENVDITSAGPAVLIPQVRAGKLKGLASTSEQRLPAYPDVPSMVELGYKGFITGGWYAMSMHAGTPAAIVTRLNAEINAALHKPAARKGLEAEAFSVDADLTPEQTTKFILDEIQKWGKVVRDNNISFE